ncbi:MAG: ThuA domain-containing protein [Lachnospiraceae bacterium]|nr:ThuA domain-containing protein [Lachnospiraceae bacterium]
MIMRKILVMGDTEARYHPLHCIFPIHNVLGKEKLTFTNDYDYFTKLNEFDLLICFVDAWIVEDNKENKLITKEQSAALLDYINNGGKILSIHTGMSIQATEGLENVHGAKFLDHPPYCEIVVNVAKGHRLTEGVNDFRINDEPYHFEVYEDFDIFANYEFDGKKVPAAWEKDHGKGKLIYLMPGHDEAVFACEDYLRLIKNCVEYLVTV